MYQQHHAKTACRMWKKKVSGDSADKNIYLGYTTNPCNLIIKWKLPQFKNKPMIM